MTEFYKLHGSITSTSNARKMIFDVVFDAISDIKDEKIPMTGEELEKRINSKLAEYLKTIKKAA